MMVWLGLAGLTASGTLLSPQLHQLTWFKPGAVLLVALIGIYAYQLQSSLEAHVGEPRRRLLLRAALTGALSQPAGGQPASLATSTGDSATRTPRTREHSTSLARNFLSSWGRRLTCGPASDFAASPDQFSAAGTDPGTRLGDLVA